MKISISRVFKLLSGSLMLLLVLNQGYLDTNSYTVLSLLAVPVIFAGLYDWRPLEFLSWKLMDKIAAFSDAKRMHHAEA